jgi:hypothetical protein
MKFTRAAALPFGTVLLVLLIAYLSVLQTIPNGSEHYYMIDVGETQIVMNVWGTLHMTGYPLYILLTGTLVALLKGLGVSAVTAPAVTSLLYSLLALSLVYVLAAHITRRRWLSALMVLLYGLTRTVWVHSAIAEIYAFGLLLLVALLLLALWQPPIRRRVYWLALLGGIAVFHHRALLMVAPALLLAAWPDFVATPRRRLPLLLIGALALGLLGFLPYAYLPLRAWADAGWVYGDPGTWKGFLDQFFGTEASHFMGLPSTLDGLLANFNRINTVLITDLTLPGVLVGLAGLLLGLRDARTRRAAAVLGLSALVAYAFHVLFYTDILSALILPITLSLAFGWLFAAVALLDGLRKLPRFHPVYGQGAVMALLVGLMAAALISSHVPFLRDLTTNPTGLETQNLVREAPQDAVLMLDWGPRHFAAGFLRDVMGERRDLMLVTHKADFSQLIPTRTVVTPEYTFYNRPVSWWQEQTGGKVYLSAIEPQLVRIAAQPERAAVTGAGVQALEHTLDCTADGLNLRVAWASATVPTADRSVFVHLLDAVGNVIAQADESAPVYGWRPLTTWDAGEVVRDVYPLPRLPEAATVAFGLYTQQADGSFLNESVNEVAVICDP